MAGLYKGGNTEKRGGGAPLLASSTGKKARGVYIGGNEATCGNGPSYFAYLNSGLTTLLSYLRTGSETNTATVSMNYCKQSETLSGVFEFSKTYQVSKYIKSSQVINNGLTVKYKAGTYVELQPDFVSGTNFVAEIDPCVSIVTIIANKVDDAEISLTKQDVKETQTMDNWLKVYPVPIKSGNSLTIEANESIEGVNLDMYDGQGKLIKTFRLNGFVKGSNTSVLMEEMPGLYYLRAQDNNRFFNQKIILQ